MSTVRLESTSQPLGRLVCSNKLLLQAQWLYPKTKEISVHLNGMWGFSEDCSSGVWVSLLLNTLWIKSNLLGWGRFILFDLDLYLFLII